MKILKKILIVLVILTFTSLTALAARNIMKKIGNDIVEGDTIQASRQSLCSGLFPNGTYTGSFEVSADGELSYYTEYLEIENGEIRIYPSFNSQTREISFNIEYLFSMFLFFIFYNLKTNFDYQTWF